MPKDQNETGRVGLLLTSSTTSRIAASFESSPGSTPPEGTTQRPGCRQLETSSTYNEQTHSYQPIRGHASKRVAMSAAMCERQMSLNLFLLICFEADTSRSSRVSIFVFRSDTVGTVLYHSPGYQLIVKENTSPCGNHKAR